jgi:hypothetical protein
MLRSYRTQAILWAAIALVSLASAPSGADAPGDGDSKEIGSYVLTEAGLARYTQAVRNLGPLAKKMSGACDADDDSENAQSLNDLAARFEATPGIAAALQSAGMTPREYLVFTFSLFQNGIAAWALDQPGGTLPEGTSMANVEFYRAHRAAIQKLGSETKPADCDED